DRRRGRGIMGKRVDDLAIGDTSLGARPDHPLKLGLQGPEAIDAAGHRLKVVSRQGIHPGTGALPLSRQIEKLAYGLDLETQLARMPDEPVPHAGGAVVLPSMTPPP